jgi:hypothetical protein
MPQDRRTDVHRRSRLYVRNTTDIREARGSEEYYTILPDDHIVSLHACSVTKGVKCCLLLVYADEAKVTEGVNHICFTFVENRKK